MLKESLIQLTCISWNSLTFHWFFLYHKLWYLFIFLVRLLINLIFLCSYLFTILSWNIIVILLFHIIDLILRLLLLVYHNTFFSFFQLMEILFRFLLIEFIYSVFRLGRLIWSFSIFIGFPLRWGLGCYCWRDFHVIDFFCISLYWWIDDNWLHLFLDVNETEALSLCVLSTSKSRFLCFFCEILWLGTEIIGSLWLHNKLFLAEVSAITGVIWFFFSLCSKYGVFWAVSLVWGQIWLCAFVNNWFVLNYRRTFRWFFRCTDFFQFRILCGLIYWHLDALWQLFSLLMQYLVIFYNVLLLILFFTLNITYLDELSCCVFTICNIVGIMNGIVSRFTDFKRIICLFNDYLVLLKFVQLLVQRILHLIYLHYRHVCYRLRQLACRLGVWYAFVEHNNFFGFFYWFW